MNNSLFAIIATIGMSPLLPIIHITFIRLRKNRPNHISYMFWSFALYSLIVFYFNFTMQNGFTAPTLTSLACLVVICLLYAEFFSMVSRGFSLQIMLDIYTGEKTELQDLINGYAGKGIHWVLTKRISSLKSMGLLSTTDKNIILTNRTALFLGNIGLVFKKIFNLPEGG